MKAIVFDVETTVQPIETVDEDTGRSKTVLDNSPYNPLNKLVTVHWRKVENGVIGPDKHLTFYHNDYPNPDLPNEFQDDLSWADVGVAHNAKYDFSYILESGFTPPPAVYCTMVGEYIIARGVRVDLSLKGTAIRRGVSNKKSDLTEEYWNDGIGFEAMPLPVVHEYADADVLACAEIYLAQLADWEKDENKTLVNIVTLMNDMLLFLVEIERNGIQIDLDKLREVGAEYQEERREIESRLDSIAKEVMGDTPINLNSSADISKLVYSREVIDRKAYIEAFNIGVDKFTGKKKHPPRMSDARFVDTVRKLTKRVYRTTAYHCTDCKGTGFIRKFTKAGEPFKKPTKCPACGARGFILQPTERIAGLKLSPEDISFVSVHGFAAAKDDMARLIAQAQDKGNLTAVSFLEGKRRLNAINTYLNSFVIGIERWTRPDGRLHAGFNQCVARTGRLSSSNPNFQNQPKGGKFPVRKAVISRFKDIPIEYVRGPNNTSITQYRDGVIMEADFSGLEFVVAGELSRDPQIIGDINSGKDIHAQTARIVYQLPDDGRNWKDDGPNEDMRSKVKPDTFAPLYGATGKDKPSHIRRYYEEFFNIYKRHGEWQLEQMDNVIERGFIRTPSGREYAFPGTRRLNGRRTSNSTKIVNYPVQGFATGDIVPLACIRALRKFRELGLQSVLVLTVHDSIVCDVHPDEIGIVYRVLEWALSGCVSEIRERWGYEMALPLKCEIKAGRTWGDLTHVPKEVYMSIPEFDWNEL